MRRGSGSDIQGPSPPKFVGGTLVVQTLQGGIITRFVLAGARSWEIPGGTEIQV